MNRPRISANMRSGDANPRYASPQTMTKGCDPTCPAARPRGPRRTKALAFETRHMPVLHSAMTVAIPPGTHGSSRVRSADPLEQVVDDRALCADMPQQLAAGAGPVLGEQGPQDFAVLARHGRDHVGRRGGEVQKRRVVGTMAIEKITEIRDFPTYPRGSDGANRRCADRPVRGIARRASAASQPPRDDRVPESSALISSTSRTSR